MCKSVSVSAAVQSQFKCLTWARLFTYQAAKAKGRN